MLARPRRWLGVFVLALWLLVPSTQPAVKRRRYLGGPRGVLAAGCEPIQLELCGEAMPYSRTRMPNLLNHASQRNARLVLDQYRSLINTRCGLQTANQPNYSDGYGDFSTSNIFVYCELVKPQLYTRIKQNTAQISVHKSQYILR